MKPVVFDSVANDEFDVAACSYEAQRDSLGDRFVTEVEECIA